MNLPEVDWSSAREKALALSIIERLKADFNVVAKGYEDACKPFINGTAGGSWSWYESALLGRRFLVTDAFEDQRKKMKFEGMAVSWKKIGDAYSPPAIQATNPSACHVDALEHEAIHVAQLVINQPDPKAPARAYPGPIPKLAERILMEFEAHFLQSVHFERAYSCRLVFDFNCTELSQFAALRQGFRFYVDKSISAFVAGAARGGDELALKNIVENIRNELLMFEASIKDTFRGTVLDEGGAIPALDQLAFHLFTQVNQHVIPRDYSAVQKQTLGGIFAPVFTRWSDYRGANDFEILERFRPPRQAPRLNEGVIDRH